MKTTEPMIPIGTLRRGFSVSSAIGATDSKPDNARMVNTTPRYRPLALGMLPGLNDEKLTPPSPGESRPEMASARNTITSRPPRNSIALAESATPNMVNAVTITTSTMKIRYQLMLQPYCELSVSRKSAAVNAQTAPTATGSYRK